MGGWWTRGIGRERVLLLTGAAAGEEAELMDLCEAEEEEKEEEEEAREAEGDGSSWLLLLATMVMVLEAEQPMMMMISQWTTISSVLALPTTFA